jgi:hypothetical protein
VAAALGAALGGATLCFASNLLLLPAAAVVLATRRTIPAAQRRRMGLAASLAFAALVVPATALAWRAAAPDLGFAAWLTSYGGQPDGGRVVAAYGIPATTTGIGLAALRALYGSAKALVDLVPAVAGWRDGGERGWPLVRVAVAMLAAWALGGGRGGWRAAAPVLWLTVPAVAVFGFLWNNSDEQFYAPLALAIGVLAACRGSRSRPALVAGAIALAWNLADITVRYGLYPRSARLAELGRLVDGADLVLYPGFDELEVLLALSPAAPPSLPVTAIASLEPAAGLERLRERARASLARGGRVVCLDLYDRPSGEPPWKFLRGVGYSPEAVRGALAGLPFTPTPALSSRLWSVRVAGAVSPPP